MPPLPTPWKVNFFIGKGVAVAVGVEVAIAVGKGVPLLDSFVAQFEKKPVMKKADVIQMEMNKIRALVIAILYTWGANKAK